MERLQGLHTTKLDRCNQLPPWKPPGDAQVPVIESGLVDCRRGTQ
jgi:hypothetical protein